MAGTKPVKYALSARDVDDEDVGSYVTTEVVPAIQSTRETVNRIVADVYEVSESGTVPSVAGLVEVDATAGAVTMTLQDCARVYHPVLIVKVDSSGNAVTVAAPSGQTISGAASVSLAAQWNSGLFHPGATGWFT